MKSSVIFIMKCRVETGHIQSRGAEDIVLKYWKLNFVALESAQNRPIKTFPVSASQVFPINSYVSGGPNEIYKATLQGTVT